jgi:hypothetical protein
LPRLGVPLLWSLLVLSAASIHAEPPALRDPILLEAYDGGFKDDYIQELTRVRTFLSIAQQNIATQLGLSQYGRGFYHPVMIRFDDGAPAISQNPYFYVQSGSNKHFQQDLMVNVEAFARRRKESNWKDNDLRNGFYYTMTQLMLNDLMKAKSIKTLPVWVQEGLAVYISGSGDSIVEEVAGKTRRSRVTDLVGELNRPFPYLSPTQWARYYLAIQYIYDTGGINALQGFVRELLAGVSPADAILHIPSQEWVVYKKNVEAYSAKVFLQHMPPDDPRFPGTVPSQGSY